MFGRLGDTVCLQIMQTFAQRDNAGIFRDAVRIWPIPEKPILIHNEIINYDK